MALVRVPLVTKPGQRVEPRDEFRTKVKKGDVVRFEVPAGATGGGIVFPDKSPFRQKNVSYGSDEPITVDVNAVSAENVYRYNCSFRLNGQDFRSDSGGEIEIIKM
jgi:hypothetical protein